MEKEKNKPVGKGNNGMGEIVPAKSIFLASYLYCKEQNV